MTRTFLLAAAVLLCGLWTTGCGTDDGDPCGIAGTWSITYTMGNGDCFTPGQTGTDTYTFTLVGNTFTVQNDDGDQPAVGTFDSNRCTMMLTYTDVIPETAQTYEFRSTSTETLTFDAEDVSTTVSVDADLYEAGTMVGTCNQNITGVGTKQ